MSSKKDTLTKQYLSRPDIFADVFNYFLFDGKKVIKPSDLQEQDVTELAVIKDLNRVFTEQKVRDVLKLCTVRHSKYATLVLLGIEGQSQVSNIMPVRDNLYDALNYWAQVQEIKRQHSEAGDLKNEADFLSGFTKDDKLIPVITLCVCFDKATWDAPKSLCGMFVDIDPRIKPFINDYKLNLVTPDEVDDFTKFSTDIGLALEFIKNSEDKVQMRNLLKSIDRYKSVDIDTVEIINTYTNVRISKKQAKGGFVDMCKAIEDLIEDGRVEGHSQGLIEGHSRGLVEGRNQGFIEGESNGENKLKRLIKLLKPDSKDYDKALNGTSADLKRLYKKYNIV